MPPLAYSRRQLSDSPVVIPRPHRFVLPPVDVEIASEEDDEDEEDEDYDDGSLFGSAEEPEAESEPEIVPPPRTSAASRSRAFRPLTPSPPRSRPDSPSEPAPPPPPLSTRIDRSRLAMRRPRPNDPILVGDSSPISGASSALSSASNSPSASGTSSRRPPVSAQSSSDDSIVALNDDEVAAIDPSAAGRRYTAAEKGKGRAVVAEPEVVVLSKKRKSGEGYGDGNGGKRRNGGGRVESVDLFGEGEDEEVDEVDMLESEDEEGEFLDEFSCPVCFCSLTKPVATLCGHILCSECLHSSLLSAVGRNPNPLPAHLHALHHAGPAPRPPARTPRTTFTRTKAKTDPVYNPSPDAPDAQPVEWTMASLQAKVLAERKREREELEKAAEAQFEATDLPRESWAAAKAGLGIIEDEGEGDGDGAGLVVEVLKGLWRIPGGTVVEGECPVCRNGIPGGFGPFHSGIGSITPLFAVLKM